MAAACVRSAARPTLKAYPGRRGRAAVVKGLSSFIGANALLNLGQSQEIVRSAVALPKSSNALSMGITHCPICIGLALLSAVRFMAHAVMAYQLERANAATTMHPAMLLGTVLEL